MKRIFALFMVTLTLLAGCNKKDKANDITDISGVLPGKFSIAQGRQIQFASGNLQYQASTATWRLAEHQWDCIGSKNSNISESYSGWIDLFGWATSGYNCGSLYYHPYDSDFGNEADGFEYGPKPVGTDLTGDYANCDWGVYAKISNSTAKFRTPTADEWEYLINKREGAKSKYGIACVEGNNGLVLLPDEWALPEGLTFKPGVGDEDDTRQFAKHNSYSASDWTAMEKAGAVFLPVTGSRIEYAEIDYENEIGKYWSVSCCHLEYWESTVYCLEFESSYISAKDYNNYRHFGRAVRLIHDVQ